MSDLQAYLAAKYMTGAKADAILDRAGEDAPKRRKKKRKVDGGSVVVAEGGGMIIADDDGMGWARQKEKDEEEDGRPGEYIVGGGIGRGSSYVIVERAMTRVARSKNMTVLRLLKLY